MKINYSEIATVLQERNFRTLPEWTDRCLNEFETDKVRIHRFLLKKAMDENIECFLTLGIRFIHSIRNILR